MKIYYKILVATLPLVLLSMISGAGITYYLSQKAINDLAVTWLETRLSEAVRAVAANEEYSRRRGLAFSKKDEMEAQARAIEELKKIFVGYHGLMMVFDEEGRILLHPNPARQGDSMAGTPWFSKMTQMRWGHLDLSWDNEPYLAVFEFYWPWGWYVAAFDPHFEVYGSVAHTRQYVLYLALGGSVFFALLLIFIVRQLTVPLRFLVLAAEKIGEGKLGVRIPVATRDEFGQLSEVFNNMAAKLQQTLGDLRLSTDRLQDLTSRLLAAQESERRWLSIELHDEIGQSLTVLKLQIAGIEKKLLPDQEKPRQACRDTMTSIDQVIENVRRLCTDLSPSALEDLGLTSALIWLVEEFARHHGLKADIDLDDLDGRLRPEQEILIYRIFQETLTNIAKHAAANHLNVAARDTEDGITITLQDNGRGFDLEAVRHLPGHQKGLGLTTIEERVRMLNASFNLTASVGGGTKLQFTIPKD